MRRFLRTATLLLCSGHAVAQGLPWIIPAEFHDRARRSDLVAAGTVQDVRRGSLETVDGVALLGMRSRFRVDTTFKGASPAEFDFTWFRLWAPHGIAYANLQGQG